jgi:hypothetical protein
MSNSPAIRKGHRSNSGEQASNVTPRVHFITCRNLVASVTRNVKFSHTMYGGREVKLHAILTSALVAGERSALCFSRFTAEESGH